jgi:hypothetical protein
MEVQTATNGSVTLVIIPNNEMEVQVLKMLADQKNELVFTDNGVTIINRSFPQGLVISKKTGILDDNNNQEQKTEEEPSSDKDESEP